MPSSEELAYRASARYDFGSRQVGTDIWSGEFAEHDAQVVKFRVAGVEVRSEASQYSSWE